MVIYYDDVLYFFKLPRARLKILHILRYYLCLILGLQSTSCILLWCLLFPGNYVVVLFSKKFILKIELKHSHVVVVF